MVFENSSYNLIYYQMFNFMYCTQFRSFGCYNW